MASEVEPVDQVEDEEEDRHSHEEETINIDVILPTNVPRCPPSETALHCASSPEE